MLARAKPNAGIGRLSPLFDRLRHDESGVALTELALVLPLLLVLLLGMIDFGKAINYWIDETHLANEGARMAIVNNNPGSASGKTLQQYILDQADTIELHGAAVPVGTQRTVHGAAVNICFYQASDGTLTTSPIVGDTAVVTVQFNYEWLHFLTAEAGVGPATTITGKSAMRLEVLPDPAKVSSTFNIGGVACPASA